MDNIFDGAQRSSAFLKALANKNRLAILCTLAEGEKNVGELENILGIRQPTLSQQLARLRADELVATRRDSKQIYYRLSSKEAEQVIGLLYKLFCAEGAVQAKGQNPEKSRGGLIPSVPCALLHTSAPPSALTSPGRNGFSHRLVGGNLGFQEGPEISRLVSFFSYVLEHGQEMERPEVTGHAGDFHRLT